MRVEPVTTSGPTTGLMTTSARAGAAASGEQVKKIVLAPSRLARADQRAVHERRDAEAAMPQTTSSRGTRHLRAMRPRPGGAVLGPLDRPHSARRPPAMMPCTSVGGTP